LSFGLSDCNSGEQDNLCDLVLFAAIQEFPTIAFEEQSAVSQIVNIGCSEHQSDVNVHHGS